MRFFLKNLINAFRSDAGWESVYRGRKETFSKDALHKKKGIIFLCVALGLTVFAALGSIVTESYEIRDFLNEKKSFLVFEKSDTLHFEGEDLSRIQLSVEAVEGLEYLYVPLYKYRLAEIELPSGRNAQCQEFVDCLVPVAGESGLITINIFHEGYELETVLGSRPFFLAPAKEMRHFRNFIYKERNQVNRRVANMARIMLALFCLLFYLMVDSSPETLGLSLFTGFEAISILFGYNGIVAPLLQLDHSDMFYRHFGWAYADVFRLYFCLQIARVFASNVKPWLLWGLVFAVPYALLRHFANDLGVPKAHDLWAWKDMAFSMAGAVILLRALQYVAKKGLKRRAFVVSIVLIGLIAEFSNAFMFMFPKVFDKGYYSTVMTLIESNSAFLFMLSTLVNISNLEDRVSYLAKENEKSVGLKKELEIARSVQQDFISKVDLPPQVSMSTHYEAASYVSGDMHFSHWDDEQKILSVLLNDVAGHGVQAALKSFGAKMIASTIWSQVDSISDEGVRIGRRGSARREGKRRYSDTNLGRFEKIFNSLFEDESKASFNAFIGVEFDLRRETCSILRVNHVFPILYDTTAGTLNEVITPNRKLVDIELKPGQMLIFLSDGLLSKAQERKSLVRHLKNQDSVLSNVEDVKDSIVKWDQSKANPMIDDKTIMVIEFRERLEEDDSHLATGS